LPPSLCLLRSASFSYNAINSIPTCASTQLTTILRDIWGFDGYITSDSGAIRDIYASHKYVKTAEEATALALKAGCDINSGGVYSGNVAKAVSSGLLNESLVDEALKRAFKVRMRLGLFDPVKKVPASYSPTPDQVGSAANHQLSYEVRPVSMRLVSMRLVSMRLVSMRPAVSMRI
jgi:beta-glucosidase-like glycosyl hydrolase